MDKDSLLALIGNLEKWALFFGILVAIGVAGESVYGIRLYWNNRKLHEIEDRDATAQRKEIARLSNETAEANVRAKEAEARAAEANLALERFKAPRTLTAEEFAHVTEAARPFAGMKFSIALFNDPEPINLAAQIESGRRLD
jgi:hypothetical protein